MDLIENYLSTLQSWTKSYYFNPIYDTNSNGTSNGPSGESSANSSLKFKYDMTSLSVACDKDEKSLNLFLLFTILNFMNFKIIWISHVISQDSKNFSAGKIFQIFLKVLIFVIYHIVFKFLSDFVQFFFLFDEKKFQNETIRRFIFI